MKLSPLLLAVRAVSAEFARRIYLPIVAIAAVVIVVVTALLIWAVTVSAWWWLLFVPVIFAELVFTTAAIIAWFALKLLRPQQTSTQKKNVRSFVDTIQQSSEAIQTPKFVILFRLVKDVMFPGKQSYVRELASTANSLRTDFQTVIRSFEQ